MAQRYPEYNPRKINRYVPSCSYAADVIHNSAYRAELGAPIAAAAAGLVASIALTSGAALAATLLEDELDARYGRNVTITSDAACTRVVTVTGRDYLGQPMIEAVTFAGAATVAGKKAFKWIDSVSIASEANTPTITVGWGDVLGMPYATQLMLGDLQDGATVTDGTLVAEVTTDPQTATTGDPRGTYDPNTACDGAKSFSVLCVLNTSNLHGVRQYFA
jgi:hypothetical protein